MDFIDTHAHLDGPEFDDDRLAVMERAREAGCVAICVPAIDLASSQRILALCKEHPQLLHAMVGLHPEEVNGGWREQLAAIRELLTLPEVTAIGEVGLDFYWSREYEKEQLEAFEEQLQWSAETQLPLMIHCRKAQNEMVKMMRRYERDLPGGVFHCFTGNEHEAAELLQFPRFVLGVGGVLTFKKSPLPQVLPQAVPLSRLVLETDAPYMAPVPHRGQRNESAFVAQVIARLAEAYQVSPDAICAATNQNVERVFGVKL